MARLSDDQKRYNKESHDQQQQAFAGAKGEIGKYDANIDTLKSGKNVGADPYKSADYLGNQNKLTAYALEGENSAAKQNLEDQNFRQGGENTSGTGYSIKNLALGKMRLSNQLQAQRSAGDYDKNLAWQQYLAGAPLQSENAWSGLFGTSSGNRNTVMGQPQTSWQEIILQNAKQAAQQAASAGAA